MTHIVHRNLREAPPVAVSGRGIWLRDASGHEVIDGSGGAAVACLGHGHPHVIQAMKDQIDRLCYAHTALFSAGSAEQLAEMLVGHAPGGLTHAYFVSSGQRGHGGCAQDRAPMGVGSRPAATDKVHRAAAVVSRQYARRAGRRRQRHAPRALCADPVGRLQPCLALLRLSRPARQRDRRRLRRTPRRRTGGGIPAPRPAERHRLLRGDCRRRDARLRHRAARLFPRHEGGVRTPRRAAHPR